MTAIEPGSKVTTHTADGRGLPRVAVTGVVDGEDFPVVWVTSEEAWESANGTPPEAWPWPAEDVEAAAP